MAKYRFEQIAINSTEKKKPEVNDRFTYLGLEHLDSGCMKVSRFGAEVAPVGDKLLMRKGDVLFGKRRAYQKKVAIAPFDGIFSAHGMVLRPREDVIDAQFFPFFISSDYFLDAAIKISVGSLSPTINWRDLKNLEFDLPTLPEQRKLAALLQSMSDTIECYKTLLTKTDELVKSQFIEMFGDPVINAKGYTISYLSEVAQYWNGLTYAPDDVQAQGTIVLRSSNIQNSSLDFTDTIRVACKIAEKKYVKENDILMCSRNGSSKLVGKVALIHDIKEPMAFGAFMMIIRSPQYYPYLQVFFQTDAFRQQIAAGATSTINQITGSMLDNVKLPIPPLSKISDFTSFVQQLDKSKFDALISTDFLSLCQHVASKMKFCPVRMENTLSRLPVLLARANLSYEGGESLRH